MKPSRSWTLLLVAAVLLVACGDSEEEPAAPQINDVRVQIPAQDPAYIDLITPEFTIEAAQERMFCIHLTNEDADAIVSEMDAMQGNFGHHVVLLSTIDPQPAGTVEDCTDASEMWKYRSFLLPDTPLPEGHGIRIPQGFSYVMQIHYVNASPTPIMVRDVARLKKVDEASVSTWVTTFTTNSLRLEIPAGGTSEETFDCTLSEDVDLLLVGGHMHEQGTSMEITVGDGETMQSIYVVDPWVPDFRDAPPVTILFDNPMHLTAGTVLRTHCAWDNQRDVAMQFPAEMCSAFGYAAHSSAPIHCEASE